MSAATATPQHSVSFRVLVLLAAAAELKRQFIYSEYH